MSVPDDPDSVAVTVRSTVPEKPPTLFTTTELELDVPLGTMRLDGFAPIVKVVLGGMMH